MESVQCVPHSMVEDVAGSQLYRRAHVSICVIEIFCEGRGRG